VAVVPARIGFRRPALEQARRASPAAPARPAPLL